MSSAAADSDKSFSMKTIEAALICLPSLIGGGGNDDAFCQAMESLAAITLARIKRGGLALNLEDTMQVLASLLSYVNQGYTSTVMACAGMSYHVKNYLSLHISHTVASPPPTHSSRHGHPPTASSFFTMS